MSVGGTNRGAVGSAVADPGIGIADRGVFLDPSGRRWRKIRGILVAVTVTVLVAVGIITTQVLATPRQVAETASPLVLNETGGAPPVVGQGPLLRVLRARERGGLTEGSDPLTGRVESTLSAADSEVVGSAPYFIERYGYPSSSARTISLTFEAGPDPVYTPRLLKVLAENDVRATFFVTSSLAVKQPDIVSTEIDDGHVVANFTVSHVNMSAAPPLRFRHELVTADRVLRRLTETSTGFVRLPFARPDDGALEGMAQAILDARRLGYIAAGYDYDTHDLEGLDASGGEKLSLPPLDGDNVTLLLHDGGANGRQRTVDYVAKLIPYAKARGYTFTTLPEAQPALADRFDTVSPTPADTVALGVVTLAFDTANTAIKVLFWFAVIAVAGVAAGATTLALQRQRVRRRALERFGSRGAVAPLPVTVLLAAYNEEAVVQRTLRTLRASTYPVTEFLVIDDGSSDATAQRVLDERELDARVRLLRQANAGKATALNRGLKEARGNIIVTVDADTIVTPSTVGNLVRHFAMDRSATLGAVAGVVRVGNMRTNLITRWQSLEYLTQITVERAAHDALGAITIIPGACAAWRREAILEAGGYSEDTLAEDCDLTLSLHRAGWRVTQDDEAYAYTEAPASVDDLLKQRTRWTFGNLQAIWKHRSMLLNRRYGWLGMLVLPWYLLSLLVPFFTIPLVAVMAVVAVRTQGWGIVLLYFLLFMVAHLGTAAVAIGLAKEDWRHLIAVPIYRAVYEPLRAYLLYSSALRAVQGVRVGWNKLQRTGVLDGDADEGGRTRSLHPSPPPHEEPASVTPVGSGVAS